MQTPNDGPTMAMPAGRQAIQARESRRLPLGTILVYVALTALAVIFCLPFVWLVLTSLKPPAEVFDPGWIPSEWRWGNYKEIFEVAPVWRWLWNTTVITVLAVA